MTAASYTPVLTKSVRAGSNLTARRFVNLAGAHASAGAYAYGVLLTDTNEDEMGAVVVLGTAPVEAGGSIDEAALVEVGTGGVAVALNEGKAVGRALQSATSGATIEVLLIPAV